MYTGRMIEQLIQTVEHAEQDARKQNATRSVTMSPRKELQAFFYQMQVTQMRVGVA